MTDLDAILGPAEGVLLDFDGPICHLFAGYLASVIADELRDYLTSEGVALDASVAVTPDPLALLRWTSSHKPELLEPLEQLDVAAEVSAAETATPTERVHEVIELVIESGRQVAIVSNNSRPAIDRFLALHGLSPKVTSIVGRVIGHPELMKPSAVPVIKAAEHLNLPTEACVLVGDSESDIAAARNAGSCCIGFARSSRRADQLRTAGASVVIHNMDPLIAALYGLLGR